ncbi:MAG: DUF4386 domain-containing protein [Anaerolineae bacterium]|nr:DUF4386 domain-containing protein [Anaerolineae bacterium]
MAAYKKTARMVGVLFIIGTAAGVLSVVMSSPLLDASDYLTEISENDTQMITGALCVLIMGLSLAMVPIVAFPVLKQQNEALALGYIVFRGALETVIYLVMVISWLVLVPISQEYVQAGASDVSNFQALGTLLVETEENAAVLMSIIFPLGALIFYYLLYRSKLIPRWLSGWGLIAVVLFIAAALLDMFDVIETESTTSTLLDMPMAFQEMVMAVWLIVKGFNPSPSLRSLPE